MEDRPWPEYRQGKPITAPRLARRLKPYGVTPKTIRIGENTAKGYKLEDLRDAFARYLPPDEAVTPSHTNGDNDFRDGSQPPQARDRSGPSRHASNGDSALPDDVTNVAADVTTRLRPDVKRVTHGHKDCDIVTFESIDISR